jgi:hypothetical protein
MLGPALAEIAERLETMSQECYEMAARNYWQSRPDPCPRRDSSGAEVPRLPEEACRLGSGLMLADNDIPPETGRRLLGFPKALVAEDNENPTSNPDPGYGPSYPESGMPDAPRRGSTPLTGGFWQLPGVPPEQIGNYQPTETVFPEIELDLALFPMEELPGELFDSNQYLIDI